MMFCLSLCIVAQGDHTSSGIPSSGHNRFAGAITGTAGHHRKSLVAEDAERTRDAQRCSVFHAFRRICRWAVSGEADGRSDRK